MSSIFFKQMLE